MTTESVSTSSGEKRKHPGKKRGLYRSVEFLVKRGYWPRIAALFKEQKPESRKREEYQISAILIAHAFKRALSERGDHPLDGLYRSTGITFDTFERATIEDLLPRSSFTFPERMRDVLAATLSSSVYEEVRGGSVKNRLLYWRLNQLIKHDRKLNKTEATSGYEFIGFGIGTAVKTMEQLIEVTSVLLQERGSSKKPSVQEIVRVVKNSYAFIIEIASGHKQVTLTLLEALARIPFNPRWDHFNPKYFQLVGDTGNERIEIRPEAWNTAQTKDGKLIFEQVLKDDWLGCPALVGTKAVLGEAGQSSKHSYKNVVEGLFEWFLDVYEKLGNEVSSGPQTS